MRIENILYLKKNLQISILIEISFSKIWFKEHKFKNISTFVEKKIVTSLQKRVSFFQTYLKRNLFSYKLKFWVEWLALNLFLSTKFSVRKNLGFETFFCFCKITEFILIYYKQIYLIFILLNDSFMKNENEIYYETKYYKIFILFYFIFFNKMQ